ncbi:MAG: NDP-sugar synthase [Chloroflexi bacterium]|nr:NDP-sugar synthase [Chloroflexota bacterium]
MRAVILVGGEGTRMRPLTCNMPKPMLPVVNRPFLEHMLDYLKRYGISDVVLSMCYRPDVIQAHFGDGRSFGVELAYAVEQTPLGTAGAVKNAEQHVDETCFVFNGDILTDLDLRAMLEFHRRVGAKVTIALTPVEDPTAYGLVETDADRRIRRFTEKPAPDQVTTNLINAGTYIIEPEVLGLVPPDTFYMFERGLFPLLLEKGEPMFGFPSHSYWIDIGTPQKYLAVHHDILLGHVSLQPPGERAGDGLLAGKDCIVDPTARIVGPVVLGDRVSLGPEASIIGPVVIGNDCQVGSGSTVEEAVVWNGTSIGEKVTVKASVAAARCTIADGAIIDGAIIADGCSIGSGNRLERGIKVWPGATLAPNTITF